MRDTEQNSVYDGTVSDSKEESILKALELCDPSLQQETLLPLSRPDIATGRTLLTFFVWLTVHALLCGILFCLCQVLCGTDWIGWVLVAFLTVILLSIKAENILCSAILLYQKHAPETVRRSCLFTPSCSEYMLLAVKKYGVFKGFFKGMHRLFRCHWPNGGEDYP